MKQLIVLGNWKANKTIEDAQQWIDAFSSHRASLPENTLIIMCPAFHHIPLFVDANPPLLLGVQDLSPYDSGPYTGEISVSMLPKRVRFALLGHSERRKQFGETDEMIAQKVKQSLKMQIRPVVCISEISQAQKLKESIPNFSQTGIILYEPLFAIGSGQADTPENANTAASQISDVLSDVPIIYGGSVVPENVSGFVKQEFLTGVGVGGASLDPDKFMNLILAASAK
jgi:triosephosphate isomerase